MKHILVFLLSIGVLAGAFTLSTKTIQKKAIDAEVGSAQVYGSVSVYGSKKTCKCPYRVMSVAGTGSTGADPFSTWIKQMYPRGTHMSLNNVNQNGDQTDISNEQIAAIEQGIQSQLDATPKRKVLVIAYSLGGSVVTNIAQKLNNPCLEVMVIDSPTSNHPSIPKSDMCKSIGGLFRNDLRQICRAEHGVVNNPNYVNWTGGTASGNAHDPFTTPRDSEAQKKIDDLRKKINTKIRSCK
jgi:predicted alpha/beta hydrolase family esterase